MADPFDQAAPAPLSRPGSLTCRVRQEAPGVWRWSVAWALADQSPTQAPALAMGLAVVGDVDGLHLALGKALSQVLGSDTALNT